MNTSTVLRTHSEHTRLLTHVRAHIQSGRAALHGSRLPLLAYAVLAVMICGWVLSLPVFPSQDAPLHLYYVHIFSELLTHQHTPYTALYAVRHWLPPYATYYYSLFLLGRIVPLETADKLFVTGSVALFAVSGHVLLRTVAPRSVWAPFLLLPVLLNWPTFMGFANFMVSVDLACLAIAAWCRSVGRPTLRSAVWFLAPLLLIVITHPLPWLFVVGFVAVELLLRYRGDLRNPQRLRTPQLRRELGILALACLPALYLAHFRAKTQTILERRLDLRVHLWRVVPEPTRWQSVHRQAFSLLHMHGIVLFLGGGPARTYRLALNAMLGTALLLTVWLLLLPRLWRVPSRAHGHRPAFRSAIGRVEHVSRRARGAVRHLTAVWFVYGCVLALAIIFVPDNFGGAYFFCSRLQILLYLCMVVAAAEALERLPRFAPSYAAFSVALTAYTLALAMRYVTPVARTVLTLRQVPPVVAAEGRPGLLVRPVGVALPPHLSFDSYNWAPIDYLRWHEIPLYNTAWLGEPLIPLRLTALGRERLDPTYFNQAPQYGEQPMLTEQRAETLLDHAGFALIQREAIRKTQHPFAIQGGSPVPAAFAEGWTCQLTGLNDWYLCLPPGNRG